MIEFMSIEDISDDELVEAWLSTRRTIELIYEFNTTEHKLYAEWKRLRREGKIPKRSRSSHMTHSDIYFGDSGSHSDHHDGRSHVTRGGFDVTMLKRLHAKYGAGCDPLLMRLREEYGEAGRPDLFNAPRT